MLLYLAGIELQMPAVADYNKLLEQLAELHRENDRLTGELAASKEAERSRSALFERCPDPIAATDMQGRILECNPAFEQLLGYSCEELQQLTFQEITPIAFAAAEAKRTEEVVTGRKPPSPFCKEYIRKDGSRVPVEINGYVLPDTSGRPWRLCAVIRDISSRLKTEQALISSEERVQLALEGGELGLWDWDIPSGAAAFDERWHAMIGYRRGETEVSHSWWQSLIHPDDLNKVIEQVNAHLSGSSPRYEAEYRLRKKNGGYAWVCSRGRIIERAADGTPLRMAGTVLDISDRKRAEEEMAAMNERFSCAFHDNPNPIAISTMENAEVLDVNDAFLRLFNFSREEVIGVSLDALGFYPPDARTAVLALLERQGAIRDLETVFETRAGEKLEGLFFAERIALQGRNCVVGTFIDRTEQRKIEREKAALEEQLRQAQKMESIGRLAGGVAHDLNNLLTPILGYAEMLIEDAKDKATRQGLSRIHRAAEAAKDLTQQLLAFGRKQLLHVRAVNLNEILADSQKLLRLSLRENIIIDIETEAAPWTVQADPAQVQQVLVNLALNAQDAMPDGGTLHVETSNVALPDPDSSRPGDHVLLRVSDTGCGMEQRVREQAFEPFFTTKAASGGTGLGLPTVYGIVRQHGGQITLSSEPGCGTSVSIYWPRAAEAPETVPPKAERSGCGGTEKILVVEDNEMVRDLICGVLEKFGYRVKGVLTVDAARRAFDEFRPDLLLTDVVLPDSNGKLLYQELQQKHPGLKVLFMSGYPGDVMGKQGGIIKDGEPFLAKPCTSETLTQKVRAVLDHPAVLPTP